MPPLGEAGEICGFSRECVLHGLEVPEVEHGGNERSFARGPASPRPAPGCRTLGADRSDAPNAPRSRRPSGRRPTPRPFPGWGNRDAGQCLGRHALQPWRSPRDHGLVHKEVFRQASAESLGQVPSSACLRIPTPLDTCSGKTGHLNRDNRNMHHAHLI